jgi:hypothetical protein
LHGVSGFLRIAERAQGDRPHAVAMTAYQSGKRVRVTGTMLANQLLVSAVVSAVVRAGSVDRVPPLSRGT